jgi:TonB family protein
MRWDERGRLWVACAASYPQIKPGEKANDYVLVCEDTDHDGRVRIVEVKAAVAWALSVLQTPQILLSGNELPLSAINNQSEAGQKLYGSLIMVITIDTRGQVISAEVSQGSGNPLLDFHAKQIARNAGPYGPFNDAMRRSMDQLALVTRFSFDHNNTLQTTLQGE